MADANGHLRREYVEALERFVKALSAASEPQWREIRRLFAEKYPNGEQPLKRLISAGANPVWIVRECLRLKPWSPDVHQTADARRWTISRMKRLSRQFAELAADYSPLRAECRKTGIGGLGEDPSPALREQAQRLARLAKQMTARGLSSQACRVRDLAEHVKLTTGHYADRDVCELLDEVLPAAKGACWTIGALQQLRHRVRQGQVGFEISTEIAELIDSQIKERRALTKKTTGARSVLQAGPRSAQ